MFDTEPIKFLQALASDWLTWLMLFITSLGSAPLHDLLIAVILLGVSLRKGLILSHLLIWTSMLTDFLKHLFSMPRPYQVDAGVSDLGKFHTASNMEADEAKGFYGFIYRHLVESYGSYGGVSYGFPSGHASATTTLFGGMSLLFNRRAIRVGSIFVIILVAVSRLYLGRHFLGDVIGGFVLGVVILFAGDRLLIRPLKSSRLFDEAAHGKWREGALLAYLLVVPFLLLAVNGRVNPEDAGRLLGLNVALLLVLRKGMPSDSGSFATRAARVILGILLFAVARITTGVLIDLVFARQGSLPTFLRAVASSFMLIWGTVEIGSAVGLYKRESPRWTKTLG
jgi:membrane-associated phospholipid phosphatase